WKVTARMRSASWARGPRRSAASIRSSCSFEPACGSAGSAPMLNRIATMGAVAAAIDAGNAGGEQLGVVMVRGQRTREAELALGHAVAEALGDAMHDRLAASVRARDQVLRIDRHACVVLLPGLRGREHAALAATKLKSALEQPVNLDGWRLQPSVSIGLALSPDDGSDAPELCLRADRACEEAWSEPDGFAFWRKPVHTQGFTREELRDAVSRNQLELYLQPVLDLRTGETAGHEARARWTHPSAGAVPPSEFIVEAERTGLIGELTRWSLTVALRHLAQLRRGGREVGMNVNLSVVAL